ncbi:uncharacterized protein LOC126816438 isoform X8 [Patella vulgata]|uniref:uncharacterized protein LOC126816438 isoform X8 n=1 Tax=Patella vulgata TaxID=6465 RepID=UPI0024A95C06|nr:uncharacterized protein LOC126816438 isoform X8 [Patella vulgata]
MTRRRLQTPGFSVSTKGHSVLRRHNYGSGAGSPTAGRRSYGYGLDYSSVSPVRSRYYSGESDYLDSQVQRATSIGSDALYETLDTANVSRNRDYDLLQSTNSAIVNSETHASPRAAVASLRARNRPQAQPASARIVNIQPRSYYQQAAIVASKLEDEPGTRRRRTPRSQYAANKYRATHKVGENPLYYSNQTASTASLTSSGPKSQKTTDRKAVRDMDGNFTKPRNILSWQYRLDSRVPPEEVLYRPTTFNRMRERLHEAQDKMDRHRQLLDRYIPDEGTTESIESRVNRKLSELETRDAFFRSGGGQSSGPNGPPISETRRRIRRVLNGTRR